MDCLCSPYSLLLVRQIVKKLTGILWKPAIRLSKDKVKIWFLANMKHYTITKDNKFTEIHSVR